MRNKPSGIDIFAASLRRYQDRFPEEEFTVHRCLELLDNPEAFVRTGRPGHFTGSALILDRRGERVLLVRHRKLNRWLQPGGHADGERDLIAVARREAAEETGLETLRLVEQSILDIDIHRIPKRKSEGAHDHYDVRYHFTGDTAATLKISDESTDIRWVPLEELGEFTDDPSIRRLLLKARL